MAKEAKPSKVDQIAALRARRAESAAAKRTSGRKITLPPGTEIKDGKVIPAAPKPRDAAQARNWAKGGRKKQRVVKKGLTALLNSIGRGRP